MHLYVMRIKSLLECPKWKFLGKMLWYLMLHEMIIPPWLHFWLFFITVSYGILCFSILKQRWDLALCINSLKITMFRNDDIRYQRRMEGDERWMCVENVVTVWYASIAGRSESNQGTVACCAHQGTMACCAHQGTVACWPFRVSTAFSKPYSNTGVILA